MSSSLFPENFREISLFEFSNFLLCTGQLVSSIVCEECHHSSQNYEQFLDLSLPVLEERPAKPSKKFSVVVSEDESTSLITSRRNKSKMLRKKDRMKRKKGKGGRNLARKNSRVAMEEEEEQEKDEKEEEQEEKEEQEEEEGEQKIREELKGTEESEKVQLVADTDITNSDNFKEKADEGFVEEKVDEADWEWDYGDPWEEKQHIVFRSTARTEDNLTETDVSTARTEDNLTEIDVSTARTEENTTETDVSTAKTEDNTTEVESLSPVQLVSVNLAPEEESHQEEESLSRPSSSISSVSVNSEEEEEDVTGASSDGDIEDNNDDDQRWVMSKNLINNLTKLDSLMKTSGNLEPRLATLCDSMSSLKLETGTGLSAKQRMTAEWTSRSLTSLGPRYQAMPGECSVYTCLNNFTQSELLTGSNKWGCQACTDQRKLDNSDTSSGEQKTVYTPASKQLLIFSPPAILTLHLKVRPVSDIWFSLSKPFIAEVSADPVRLQEAQQARQLSLPAGPCTILLLHQPRHAQRQHQQHQHQLQPVRGGGAQRRPHWRPLHRLCQGEAGPDGAGLPTLLLALPQQTRSVHGTLSSNTGSNCYHYHQVIFQSFSKRFRTRSSKPGSLVWRMRQKKANPRLLTRNGF